MRHKLRITFGFVFILISTFIIFDNPIGDLRSLLKSFLYGNVTLVSGMPKGLIVAVHPTKRSNGLRVARLVTSYTYCDEENSAIIHVPSGYATNFASIPYGLRFIFNPMGNHMEAAVIHDWLYSAAKRPIAKNRYYADLLFREILREHNVNLLKRNIMYLAVRIYGNKYYKPNNQISFYDNKWNIFKVSSPKLVIDFSKPEDCNLNKVNWEKLIPKSQIIEMLQLDSRKE